MIPRDFITFLEQLDPLRRKELSQSCEPVKAGSSEIICEQGATSDAIYFIEKGVVEVITLSPDGQQKRSVAILKRGDFFGELGVLTGQGRSARIQVIEPVLLWKMPADVCKRLLERIPDLGAFLSANLAARLYQSTILIAEHSYANDLGGNLRSFDMLQIFQTITGSADDGELHLLTTSNDLIGSFFFFEHSVTHARFAHLEGIEAVWQIFVEDFQDGSFNFQICDKPEVQYDESKRISVGGTDLLMQAASKRDSFENMPPILHKLSGRLERLAPALNWQPGPEEFDLAALAGVAQNVMDMCARVPQTLDSLWRREKVCAYHLALVAEHLHNTGQARVIE